MADFEHLDHYELLGVSRSASADEIKRAFRREIAKYHPDRFATATSAEQEYARLRSQRLTEAYTVLSDFSTRNAYNRGQSAPVGVRRARSAAPPTQPRDHQAELYEQAQEHLAAGRTLQAIGVLRQLQQINPFYRDSATLLAQAEAQVQGGAGPRSGRRRPLWAVGALAVVLLIGVGAWSLMRSGALANTAGQPNPTAAPIAVVNTAEPTAAPSATAAPTDTPLPTEPPVPTDVPTNTPLPTDTPEPTVAPTDTPVPEPTAPPSIESGALVLSDGFDGANWPVLARPGWSIGFQDSRYQIVVAPGIGNIWSYRTGMPTNATIGVDTEIASGAAGLLMRYIDIQNYLSFTVNPQLSNFRFEQHSGGTVNVLAGGQTDAIATGASAQNRLVARLNGGRFQLFVNNRLVAEGDLPSVPVSNRYGLLANSSDQAANALFDNLEIRTVE